MKPEFEELFVGKSKEELVNIARVSVITIMQRAFQANDIAEGLDFLDSIDKSGILDVFDETDRKTLQTAIDDVRAHLSPLDTDQTFSIIKTLFGKHGIKVEPVKGKCWFGNNMVTHDHDGVPYTFDLSDSYGKVNPSKLAHNLLHYRLTVERHHEKVKAVYEFLKQKEELGDVWAMLGGGSQLQVFFGNSTGYLAILYLDMENTGDQKRLSNSGYLAATGNKSFTLSVQWGQNNKHFRGIKVPGVKLRRSTSD